MNEVNRKKLMRLNQETWIWGILPLYGLSIEDQEDWRDFIFEDATIVNANQLHEKIKDLDRILKPHQKSDDITPDSFLIVIYPESNESNEINDESVWLDETVQTINIMRNRGREIVSFLNLIFLYATNLKYKICTYGQIYASYTDYFWYRYPPRFENPDYTPGSSEPKFLCDFVLGMGHINDYKVEIPSPPFIYSRKKLIQLFEHEFFKGFSEIIRRDCTIRDKKYSRLFSSLVCFYLGINVPATTTQFFSTMSALEVLLKDDSGNDYSNRIKLRMDALLGQEFEMFGKNLQELQIFKTRNEIVHKGKEANKDDVQFALKAYISSFITLSHLISTSSMANGYSEYLNILLQYQESKVTNTLEPKDENKWREAKLNASNIDWFMLALLSVNKLCNPKLEDDRQHLFGTAVLWYSIETGSKLSQSFKVANKNFLSHDPLFKTYDEFKNYITENGEKIREFIYEVKQYMDKH